MSRNAFQPSDVFRPKLPFSPVVVSGDLVVTGGSVGFDASGTLVEGGIEEQTRQTLENLSTCLASVGCSFDDVIKVSTFLTDLDNSDAYNTVYREYFSEPYPARTTVQAGLPGGLLIEIDMLARRPE